MGIFEASDFFPSPMINLFSSAGRLAADRRRLAKRLMDQSLSVAVFSDDMLNNLRLPTATKGISFLFESVVFIGFVLVLSFTALRQRMPEVSRSCAEGIKLFAARNANLSTSIDRREELIGALVELPNVMLSLSPQSWLLVGGVRVKQLKVPCRDASGSETTTTPQSITSSSSRAPTSVNVSSVTMTTTTMIPVSTPGASPIARSFLSNSVPRSCALELSTATIATAPFVGPRTNVTFDILRERKVCVGILCAEPATSAVSELRYPGDGYVLLAMNGSWWVEERGGGSGGGASQQAASPSPTPSGVAPISSPQTFAKPFTSLEERRDLILDYLGFDRSDDCRFVSIEIPLLNPYYRTLTVLVVEVELPATGGVFTSIDARVLAIGVESTAQRVMQVFIVVFAAGQLFVLVLRVLSSLCSNKACVACSGSSARIIMFNCLKCHCPTPVEQHVTLCSSCGAAVPSLMHKCIRRFLYNPWTFLDVLNSSTLIVWYYLTSLTTPIALEQVQLIWTLLPQKVVPFDASFEGVTELSRSGINLIAVCIALTFVRLFGLVCRGSTLSRFQRVLFFGLPTVSVFLASVMVIFIAFTLAFHVTIGDSVPSFRSFSKSALATFRMMTLNAEWTQDGEGIYYLPMAIVLFLSFVTVVVTCMMNILPAILTVAFKKAMNSPHYDPEVLSLWVMMKPVLRMLGVVRQRRARGRKRSGSRASSEASTASSQYFLTQAGKDEASSPPRPLTSRDRDDDVSSVTASSCGDIADLSSLDAHEMSLSDSVGGSFAGASSDAFGVGGLRANAIDAFNAVVASGGDAAEARHLLMLTHLAETTSDLSEMVEAASSAMVARVTALQQQVADLTAAAFLAIDRAKAETAAASAASAGGSAAADATAASGGGGSGRGESGSESIRASNADGDAREALTAARSVGDAAAAARIRLRSLPPEPSIAGPLARVGQWSSPPSHRSSTQIVNVSRTSNPPATVADATNALLEACAYAPMLLHRNSSSDDDDEDGLGGTYGHDAAQLGSDYSVERLRRQSELRLWQLRQQLQDQRRATSQVSVVAPCAPPLVNLLSASAEPPITPHDDAGHHRSAEGDAVDDLEVPLLREPMAAREDMVVPSGDRQEDGDTGGDSGDDADRTRVDAAAPCSPSKRSKNVHFRL